MKMDEPNSHESDEHEEAAAPSSPREFIAYYQRLSDSYSKLGDTEKSTRYRDLARRVEDGLLDNYIEQTREVHRADLREWEARWAHYRAWQLENVRGVLNLAQAGLKGFMLVNAGAIVALLAFLGNVWDKGVRGGLFIGAMGTFAAGLFMAALAGGLSYYTQLLYSAEDDAKKHAGERWHRVASLVALSSLALFAVGACQSILAFRAQPALQQTQPTEQRRAIQESATTTTTASATASATAAAGTTTTDADKTIEIGTSPPEAKVSDRQ